MPLMAGSGKCKRVPWKADSQVRDTNVILPVFMAFCAIAASMPSWNRPHSKFVVTLRARADFYYPVYADAVEVFAAAIWTRREFTSYACEWKDRSFRDEMEAQRNRRASSSLRLITISMTRTGCFTTPSWMWSGRRSGMSRPRFVVPVCLPVCDGVWKIFRRSRCRPTAANYGTSGRIPSIPCYPRGAPRPCRKRNRIHGQATEIRISRYRSDTMRSALGYVRYHQAGVRPKTRFDYRQAIAVCLAGIPAELKVFGSFFDGATSLDTADLNRATEPAVMLEGGSAWGYPRRRVRGPT
ncbi:hypothetical protein SAMN04487976_12026 [Xaviernesmea oryzae]|nr:hypothetical protein SAMN04487976_12026 [Xaviernesmea oryzae]